MCIWCVYVCGGHVCVAAWMSGDNLKVLVLPAPTFLRWDFLLFTLSATLLAPKLPGIPLSPLPIWLYRCVLPGQPVGIRTQVFMLTQQAISRPSTWL